MKKLTVLIMTMLLIITPLCAFAEATPEEAAAAPVTLLTIGGKQITYDDLAYYASYLAYAGYITDESDLKTALDYYLISEILPELKVNELGAEALLGDKYQASIDSATAEFEAALDSYAKSLLAEDYTQEQYDEAYAQAIVYYAENGYELDAYVGGVVLYDAFDAYISTLGITVTPEEIAAEYDNSIAEQISYFEGNVSLYEYYVNYYGYAVDYMPSGYRGVTHILLEVDEELLNAYTNAATDEDKASALAGALDSRKADIDAIYARLESGEDFGALIAEYGTDPGMSGDNLINGYPVHADSIVYDQAFTDGAFSEKMLAPGDVSEPVLSGFGIHILYYLRDIPSGAPEISDDVSAQIYDYLYGMKQNEYFTKWLSEYETVYADDFADYVK